MKTLLNLFATLGTLISLFAQEYDDMYFRARHRQAETAQPVFANRYEKLKQEQLPETTPLNINPTDSYSARQLNPEFIARSRSERASVEEENYFVENYRPTTTVPFTNSYLFNSPWNNPWSMGWNRGWFAPGWTSLWGNWGFYDPWMNSWGPGMGWGWSMWSPVLNSMWAPGFGGWTVSVGYSWGNAWGWNNPWCMPYWGTGFWPYWNTGLWNRSFVGWSEPVRFNYGKRPSSLQAVAGDVRRHYTGTERTTNTIQSSTPTSGRMREAEYYVPPARRSAPARQGSFSADRENATPRMRSWSAPDNSQFNRSGGGMRDVRPSYSAPSRSSGSFPSGGGRPSPAPSGGRPRGIQ